MFPNKIIVILDTFAFFNLDNLLQIDMLWAIFVKEFSFLPFPLQGLCAYVYLLFLAPGSASDSNLGFIQ